MLELVKSRPLSDGGVGGHIGYYTTPKHKGVSSILQETYKTFADNGLIINDDKDIMTLMKSDRLYEQYIKSLSQGLDANETIVMTELANTSKKFMLFESVNNPQTYTPYMSVTPPMFRDWLGLTIIKDTFPIEVAKRDFIEKEFRIDYFIDQDGSKATIKDYFKSVAADIGNYNPVGRVKIYDGYLPITTLEEINLISGKNKAGGDAVDLPGDFVDLTTRDDVDAKDTITHKFYVIGAKMKLPIGRDHGVSLVDYVSAKDPEVTVPMFELALNQYGVVTGTLKYTVATGEFADDDTKDYFAVAAGTVYSDTFTGTLDKDTGFISFIHGNQIAPTDAQAKAMIVAKLGKGRITALKLTTHVSNFRNKITMTTDFAIKTIKKTIDEGRSMIQSVAPEYVMDFINNRGMDPTTILTENMTTIFDQELEMRSIKTLHDSFINNGFGLVYEQSFDARPVASYHGPNGREATIISLNTLIDKIVRKMKNNFRYPGGRYILVGHPDAIQLLADVQWTYTSEGGQERNGVYAEGVQVGSFRSPVADYTVVSSFYWTENEIRIIFYPNAGDDRELTYLYTPYYFYSYSSKEGMTNLKELSIPSMGLYKRDDFLEYRPIQGRVVITHNGFAHLDMVKPVV